MTEKEKMLAGELYDPMDPELREARLRARQVLARYNATDAGDAAGRAALLAELVGRTTDAFIEPPFRCDYGTNLVLGERVYFNFACVVLDVAQVTIGDRVLFGPNVQIYAATHPLDAAVRRRGLELGFPVSIGDDAWIGGNAVICPGVRIGARAVIGAGSVVVRDIPDDVLAAGNPCRVLRPIDPPAVSA